MLQPVRDRVRSQGCVREDAVTVVCTNRYDMQMIGAPHRWPYVYKCPNSTRIRIGPDIVSSWDWGMWVAPNMAFTWDWAGWEDFCERDFGPPPGGVWPNGYKGPLTS
jgi:hypothetical protein